jgi:uncharacterized protein YxjI
MLLNKKTYLVKEKVGFVKLTEFYDIFDPGTGQQIGFAREEVHPVVKYLRLIVSRKLMPTTVNFYEHEGGRVVLSIHRNVALFRPRVTVTRDNQVLGTFQSKVFTIGGAFRVFDPQEREVALIQGDWKGWNFVMKSASGEELGRVTKKWAGIGKELFTTADNYVIDLAPRVAGDPNMNALLLAAGIAIDTVLKEKSD